MLTSLTYFSAATVPFSRGDLLNLLDQSRERNAEVGITGMMLFHDAHFVQVLEGPDEHVRATFARICQDTRHRSIHVELEDSVEERMFPDWSMGFRDVADGSAEEIAGFSALFRQVREGEDSLGDQPTHHLLRAFSRPARFQPEL